MVTRIAHTVLVGEEIKSVLKKDELFYSKSWIDAVSRGFGCEVMAVLTSFMGDHVLLGIYFVLKKGVLKFAGAPLMGTFTPYLDPIWHKELEKEERREVFLEQFKYLKKLGFSHIEYGFRDFGEAEEFLNKDFNLLKKETYILNMQRSLDSIWNNFTKECQKNIKEALQNRIEVEKIEACEFDVEDFYEILKALYAKKDQKPRHSLHFFKEIVYRMQEDNKLLFQRAVLNSEIIAIKIYLFDKSKFFYLCDASLDIAYETKAVYLMHWYSIKFAKDLGVLYYDFNSKGDPLTDGLKESFSPTVYERGRLIYRNAVAKSAEEIYMKLFKIDKKA